MLTFKALLEATGLDTASVRLVRHQTSKGSLTPWELWRSNAEQFELYQRIQRRNVFEKAEHIASFVVTPDGRTVFVGLYRVDGIGSAPSGTRCPITHRSCDSFFFYDLTACDLLSGYGDRLVVDWGDGHRSWVQRADRHEKPIVELAATEQIDPPFPGFLEFRESLSSISALPRGWREALANVRGIYLLTDPETGESYIGSAAGNKGFLGRWLDYVATGHGGNLFLKGRETSGFDVTILEVAASNASVDEIIARESLWKDKLGTRVYGLNAN